MEIIGKIVSSKFTGAEGRITSIAGKKLRVSFCYGGDCLVPVEALVMDPELAEAIKVATSPKRRKVQK